MLKSKYFYEDEYMYFTFNSRHSSLYNLIIENDKGLPIFVDRGSKLELTQPQYQNGQYMLGVTHPQRSLPLKLFGSDLTEAQIAEILKWLSVGTSGSLSFDYDADWEYDVAISQIKNPVKTTSGYHTFNIEIDITFVTLKSSLAKNKIDGFGTIDLDTDTTIDANTNNKYTIPNFILNATPISGGYELNLKIHCLGNDKIELGFIAEETLGRNSTKFIDMQTNDINNYYTKALLKTSDIDFNERPFVLEYRPRSNMFLINNYVGEEYIKNSNLLEAQSSPGQDTNQYSNFIYNKDAMTVMSPSAPVLIDSHSNIGYLLTTPYTWFICVVNTQNTSNSEIPYYIQNTTSSGNHITSTIIYDYEFAGQDFDSVVGTITNLRDGLSFGQNLYFGFYCTVRIITNFKNVSAIITQYKNNI